MNRAIKHGLTKKAIHSYRVDAALNFEDGNSNSRIQGVSNPGSKEQKIPVQSYRLHGFTVGD